MKIIKASEMINDASKATVLIYAPPGAGKTTALGFIADNIAKKTGKRTLLLDVDKTSRVLAGNKNIDIVSIDNIDTWNDWSDKLLKVVELVKGKDNPYGCVCVDNISELERCILADLGRQGKNKGVPALADYQYMQFKLVGSLRHLREAGIITVWTSWETVKDFTHPDGTQFSRKYPKISDKIVDNICGLCDIVANLIVKNDGARGFILESQQNIYAKNQIDDRKGCIVEELIK